MAAFEFNAATAPKSDRSHTLLPAGWYLAHIIESDVVALDNQRTMVKLTFDVLQGTHQGRRLWVNLLTRHTSAETQRIAQENLGELAMAINKPHFKDTADLHLKPVMIKVVVKKPGLNPKYPDPSNEVKGYKPPENAAPPRPAPYAPAPAPAAAPTIQAPADPDQTAPAPSEAVAEPAKKLAPWLKT